MQCYRYLAAVTAIADSIDGLPGERGKMPYNVIAEWMAQNGIEADELLDIGGDEIRSLVEEAIQHNHPGMPDAA